MTKPIDSVFCFDEKTSEASGLYFSFPLATFEKVERKFCSLQSELGPVDRLFFCIISMMP